MADNPRLIAESVIRTENEENFKWARGSPAMYD
jgi:hypothetical protein